MCHLSLLAFIEYTKKCKYALTLVACSIEHSLAGAHKSIPLAKYVNFKVLQQLHDHSAKKRKVFRDLDECDFGVRRVTVRTENT